MVAVKPEENGEGPIEKLKTYMCAPSRLEGASRGSLQHKQEWEVTTHSVEN